MLPRQASVWIGQNRARKLNGSLDWQMWISQEILMKMKGNIRFRCKYDVCKLTAESRIEHARIRLLISETGGFLQSELRQMIQALVCSRNLGKLGYQIEYDVSGPIK